MSMPELIVAMALFSLAMVMITGLFIGFTNNFTKARQSNESINVAAIGMNEMTKLVRAGTIIDLKTATDKPVFVKADKEEVIFHSYIADTSVKPAPVLVRFGVDATRNLIESRWAATKVGEDWTFPALVLSPAPSRITATPTATRPIASKLIAPTAAQVTAGEFYLFTYLDEDGVVIPSPVATASLGNIASVKITMLVQADDTARSAPVKLQNRVGLPNLTSSRLGLNG